MKRRMPATPLFLSSGVPSRPLRGLLMETGFPDLTDARAVREVVMKHWRKPGLQAAEIKDEDAHLLERVRPFFKDLGLIGVPQLEPGKRQWCAILGATYAAMHKRIAHAVRMWERDGVQWTNTAFLVSTRKRFADDKETDAIITAPVEGGLSFDPNWKPPTSLPTTEHELMVLILNQIWHHLPWEKTNRHEFVVLGADKSDGRPAGTRETLEAFAKDTDPRGESLVIISSQPHILRQGIETSVILGDRFELYEPTGYDMPKTPNVTQTFDELAKLIFDIVGAD